MTHDRRTLFGTDVAAYDAGRPGYPDRVFELLRERCGLGPGSEVVEIGPGTGQATRGLLEAGASVHAVELSEPLAECLRSTYPSDRLTVTVSAFEDAELEPESADLVASATAFHWVPTALGVQRCAEVLRTHGHLAVWWNVYGDTDRPDPFHDALLPILERLAPSVLDVPGAGSFRNGSVPYALDAGARISEIRAEPRFVDVYHETISWTGRHRPHELRALFATFSPWLALPDDQRTTVLDALERLAEDEFGGLVERPYLTPIYIAPSSVQRLI